MNPNGMAEAPIEELSPDWIGLAMEVDTQDGTRVGFRLARYEKTARDNEPLWILFSADHAWRTEVHTGSKVRWMPRPNDATQPASYYPHTVPVAAPAAPPPPAPHLTPQSWVVPPSAGPR